MAAITRLKAASGRPQVRVHVDGAFWRTLPLALVVEQDLSVGLEVDAARLAALEAQATEAEAVSYALRSLDFRMASSSQLRDRLTRRGYGDAVIAATIAACARMGALDDRGLAATRARRFRDGGYAAYATRQRLRRQGFADADLDAALAEAYAGYDAEAEARRVLAARPSSAATRSRAYGLLARRGFPADVARRVAAEAADDAPARREVDVAELERQVRRRYPAAASDAGARRRAHAWLQRRGATPSQIRDLLA